MRTFSKPCEAADANRDHQGSLATPAAEARPVAEAEALRVAEQEKCDERHDGDRRRAQGKQKSCCEPPLFLQRRLLYLARNLAEHARAGAK